MWVGHILVLVLGVACNFVTCKNSAIPHVMSLSDEVGEADGFDLTTLAAVVAALLVICIVGLAAAVRIRRGQRMKSRACDQMKGPTMTNPKFNLSSQQEHDDVYEIPALATKAYSAFPSVHNVSAVYEAPVPQRHAQSRDADTEPARAKRYVLKLDESIYVAENSESLGGEYVDVDL